MTPYLLERDGANVRVGWGFPVACQGSPVESFTFQYIRLDATCLEINGQMPDSCTWETAMADQSLFEDNVESPEEATWSTAVESVGPTISHIITNLLQAPLCVAEWLRLARKDKGLLVLSQFCQSYQAHQ